MPPHRECVSETFGTVEHHFDVSGRGPVPTCTSMQKVAVLQLGC